MKMCTEESAFRQRYGVLGEDWDWADEGAVSLMGIPAKIKVYSDSWTEVGNESWKCLTGGVYPYSENGANQISGDESPYQLYKAELYKNWRENYDAALEKVDQSKVCPMLIFKEEEDEMAPQRSDLRKEVTIWRVYFLNGTKDITSDKDWNEYLDLLKSLGLQAYIDAAQHSYDRLYKSGT